MEAVCFSSSASVALAPPVTRTALSHSTPSPSFANMSLIKFLTFAKIFAIWGFQVHRGSNTRCQLCQLKRVLALRELSYLATVLGEDSDLLPRIWPELCAMKTLSETTEGTMFWVRFREFGKKLFTTKAPSETTDERGLGKTAVEDLSAVCRLEKTGPGLRQLLQLLSRTAWLNPGFCHDKATSGRSATWSTC